MASDACKCCAMFFICNINLIILSDTFNGHNFCFQHYFLAAARHRLNGNRRMRIRFGMALTALGDINMDGYYGKIGVPFWFQTTKWIVRYINHPCSRHNEKGWQFKSFENLHKSQLLSTTIDYANQFDAIFYMFIVDLAVSAPYDGTDHTGAVYIFHGSENGIKTLTSQVCPSFNLQYSFIPLRSHAFDLSLTLTFMTNF